MPYVFVMLTGVFAGAYAYVKHSAALFSRLFFKAAASVMLVLVAVSARLEADETYYTLILIGLCFSLTGDVLLVFTSLSRHYLTGGLIAFIGTHIFYIIAFWTIAAPAWYDGAFFIIIFGAGMLAFKIRSIRSKKTAVYIYATALCAMAARAFAMLFAKDVSVAFAICAAVGGVLFALSDMLLAFSHIGESSLRTASVLSTAAYYGGQALIALTVLF